MTNKYSTEIISGNLNASGDAQSLAAQIVGDLNVTQIVTRHAATSRVSGSCSVVVEFWAEGLPEAEAAIKRAGRSTLVAHDVLRVVKVGS